MSERRHADEELRRSEERFRLLVESVQDYAIFMLDPQGNVATWNAGAERIKGYRVDEIVGRHFSRFYTEEDRAAGRPQRLLAAAARDGRVEDEGWRVRKDGSRFWADVVLTAVHDASGALVGFAKVTRDLTERRLGEEERLRLARAEEAVHLRDEFLSIASHELRTPLTSLLLQLESLRRHARDGALARKAEHAAHAAARLRALVSELFDVSRLATGRLTLKRRTFSLADAVHDVAARLEEEALHFSCELAIAVSGDTTGTWDRLRVEQVVAHLLSNAFKYGSGRPVRIRVRDEAGAVVLTVSDGGGGFPEEALPRLFRRFERASSPRNYGGLGLGLYAAREIVEAHGGSLSAANGPSGGAEVTVRLPRGDDAQAATQPG